MDMCIDMVLWRHLKRHCVGMYLDTYVDICVDVRIGMYMTYKQTCITE